MSDIKNYLLNHNKGYKRVKCMTVIHMAMYCVIFVQLKIVPFGLDLSKWKEVWLFFWMFYIRTYSAIALVIFFICIGFGISGIFSYIFARGKEHTKTDLLTCCVMVALNIGYCFAYLYILGSTF